MNKENILNEFLVLQEKKKGLIKKSRQAIYKVRLGEVSRELNKISKETLDEKKHTLAIALRSISDERTAIRARELELAQEYAKLHEEVHIDDQCTTDYLVILYHDSDKLIGVEK